MPPFWTRASRCLPVYVTYLRYPYAHAFAASYGVMTAKSRRAVFVGFCHVLSIPDPPPLINPISSHSSPLLTRHMAPLLARRHWLRCLGKTTAEESDIASIQFSLSL